MNLLDKDMHMDKFTKTKKFLIFFFIFLVTLCIRIHFILKKQYMYFDAPLSYISATPNNLSPEGKKLKNLWFDINYKTGKKYTVKEIKQFLFKCNPSIKSIAQDIKTMYIEPIDYSHPNLYFTIFRIFASGIDGTNAKKMINRGCYINLVFFTFAFFFMYKLLNLIKKDDTKFISLGLLFAFLSSGTLSDTLLIREYAMMEMLFIVACYIFAKLYLHLENQNEQKNIRISNIIIYSIGFSLFLLSGYYAIIMYSLMFLTLFYLSIQKKANYFTKQLLCLLILSIILTFVLCIHYMDFKYCEIFYYTSQEDAKVILQEMLRKPYQLCSLLLNFFLNKIFILLLFLSCIIDKFIFKKKYEIWKGSKLVLFLVALSLIWTIIVFVHVPYAKFHYLYCLRFIAPCFPVLSILITLFIYKMNSHFIVNIILLLAYAAGIFSNNVVFFNHLEYQKNFYNFLIETDKKANMSVPIVFVLNQDKIIYKKMAIFRFYASLVYVNNNRIIIFEKEEPKKNYHLKNYILVTQNKFRQDDRSTYSYVQNK